MCPFELGLTVTAEPALMLPGNEDTVTVSGTLGRADPSAPAADYQARAFVADRLVSNVDRVAEDGSFHLRVQKSVASAAAQPVRIELAPVDPMRLAVQFVTELPPGGRGLDNLVFARLPGAGQLHRAGGRRGVRIGRCRR
jgi:hypothetical protein